MRKYALLFVASILALPGPGNIIAKAQDAQQASPAVGVPADTLEVRARTILVELNAAVDSMYALSDRVSGANRVEHRLIRSRMFRYAEAVEDLETELVGLIPALEATGLAADPIRQDFESFLSREAALLSSELNKWAGAIAELRATRSLMPPEQLSDLEVRIGASEVLLDSILASTVQALAVVERLGLGTSAEWAFLDRFMVGWAESQAGRLQIAIVDRDRLQTQIGNAERAGAAGSQVTALRARFQAVEERIDGIVTSLGGTADLLDQRGFETAHYREIVFKTTGEVTVDLLNPRVLGELLRDAAVGVWTWITDTGPTLVVKFFIIIISVILFRIGARLMWWLFQVLRLVHLPKLATDLVGRILRPFATFLGLVSGLWFVGVDPTALITGLGVAGIIIGLALQDSLSNLAAGLFILTNQPYDMGDEIEVGGVVGRVKEMGLANTTILTYDATQVHVPNRKIWGDIIENRSAEDARRVEVTVSVGYQEDVNRVLDVLRNLMEENETVLDEPQPSIHVSDLAASWIEIDVQPWVRSADWRPFEHELRRLIQLRFDEAGIEVAYPVSVRIHSHPEVGGAGSGDSSATESRTPESAGKSNKGDSP